jgi:cellulose synthase operon protein YhjQ
MKILALQGIRGGVGTTSIVAGLALAAWEQGARVLAIDLCPDNLLGLHLGLPQDHARGWSRLADPALEWRSALSAYESGLDLLPHGGQPASLSGDWLAALAGYDLVLLDLPPGPVPAAVSRLLTVVNADANCHVRLYRHACAADERLLVTQFTSRRALQQDLLDLWLAGGQPLLSLRLHRDEAMAEAMAAKQPVGRYAPDSLIAQEIGTLARWCLDAGDEGAC